MIIFHLNAGRFKTYFEANEYMKKHFPSAFIFACDNEEFTIRIGTFVTKEKADSAIDRLDKNFFWISPKTV